MARETWKRARIFGSIVGPGLTLFLAAARPVAAEEPPCPGTTARGDADEADPRANPPPIDDSAQQPITIDADDDDFQFDVNGNARLCGNVELRQGQRVVRTDCLEYNSQTERAKLEGGVEYTDPTVHVRGGNGTYSPATRAAPPPTCRWTVRAR
jgi:lipopolysaccharide assembly outer membrane protein LptD (OstA)